MGGSFYSPNWTPRRNGIFGCCLSPVTESLCRWSEPSLTRVTGNSRPMPNGSHIGRTKPGRWEVYVRSFPEGGGVTAGKWQVSMKLSLPAR